MSKLLNFAWFKPLVHRHTWRTLKVEYRYPDRKTPGRMITVKRCQCRDCGKILYIHFDGKNIVY